MKHCKVGLPKIPDGFMDISRVEWVCKPIYHWGGAALPKKCTQGIFEKLIHFIHGEPEWQANRPTTRDPKLRCFFLNMGQVDLFRESSRFVHTSFWSLLTSQFVSLRMIRFEKSEAQCLLLNTQGFKLVPDKATNHPKWYLVVHSI